MYTELDSCPIFCCHNVVPMLMLIDTFLFSSNVYMFLPSKIHLFILAVPPHCTVQVKQHMFEITLYMPLYLIYLHVKVCRLSSMKTMTKAMEKKRPYEATKLSLKHPNSVIHYISQTMVQSM